MTNDKEPNISEFCNLSKKDHEKILMLAKPLIIASLDNNEFRSEKFIQILSKIANVVLSDKQVWIKCQDFESFAEF